MTVTGLSPAEVLLGQNLRPLVDQAPKLVIDPATIYEKEMIHHCIYHMRVKEATRKANKIFVRKPGDMFQRGDVVYLATDKIPLDASMENTASLELKRVA